MNSIDGLRELLRHYADGALELQEFTALLGVARDVPGLENLLERLDKDERPEPGGAIQNLRWVLFQPAVHHDDPPEKAAEAPYALVLSFVFDGEVDDALEALASIQSTRSILSYCPGDARDVLAYLKKHRVKSGYMFRDLGADTTPGPKDPRCYGVDASKSEIEDAFRIQQRFEQFYADHSSSEGSPANLREAFLAKFAGEEFPFPLTRFERRLPDEGRIIRRLSEVVRRMQERVARHSSDGLRRRGAHAKGHGFLRGTLEVASGIPPEYAKGIFAVAGRQFALVARPSNGNSDVNRDAKPDARGLALSVQVPLRNGHTEKNFLLPVPNGGPGRQDFLLFSHPEFFVADVRDALTVFSIMSLKSVPELASRAFAFVAGAGAWRQAGIARRALLRWVTHPLEPTFHSATPYLLGKDSVVKYSVEPEVPVRGSFLRVWRIGDFLRGALRERLDSDPMVLKFYVHPLDAEKLRTSGKSISDVVEDATTDWTTLASERVHVATIRFEPQDPTTPEALWEGENWTFDPWNALEAHRPLGSINRGRLKIMTDSVSFRQDRAAAANARPTEAGARRESTYPGERDAAAE